MHSLTFHTQYNLHKKICASSKLLGGVSPLALRKLRPCTVTYLLNFIDSWLKNSDKGKINLSMFLDLKKAFNIVDHKALLLKLGQYSIESTSYRWLTSYLTNRKQFCYCDWANSTRGILKCGIHQGSCLGPLLFLLCINDFRIAWNTWPPKCMPMMHA